jgi:hypothetical protein
MYTYIYICIYSYIGDMHQSEEFLEYPSQPNDSFSTYESKDGSYEASLRET